MSKHTAIERASRRHFRWMGNERMRLFDELSKLQDVKPSNEIEEAANKRDVADVLSSLTTITNAIDVMTQFLREEVNVDAFEEHKTHR